MLRQQQQVSFKLNWSITGKRIITSFSFTEEPAPEEEPSEETKENANDKEDNSEGENDTKDEPTEPPAEASSEKPRGLGLK